MFKALDLQGQVVGVQLAVTATRHFHQVFIGLYTQITAVE
jgi:hypothetical protein